MTTSSLDHWLLFGIPASGKSTLAANMTPEYLVIDADRRWSEQETGKSHIVQGDNALTIVQEANKIPRGKIGTVIIDSATAILDPISATGRLKADEARAMGGKFNMDDVNRNKADTMRILRSIMVKHNANSVWIGHYEQAMMQGKSKVRQSITAMEVDRLKCSLTAIMEVFIDASGKRRGVKILWTRYNQDAQGNAPATNQMVWDPPENKWVGIPPMISQFLREYRGTEGYTGKMYTLDWVFNFLNGKGKSYLDVNAMRSELSIETVPAWWDRNAWAEIITRSGVKV